MPPTSTDQTGAEPTFTRSIAITVRQPSKLRNLELVLLLVALGIAGTAIALVQLGVNGSIDLGVLIQAGALGMLALGMHVALRVVARDADPFILPIATTLNGLGIAMIYRIDLARGDSGWESLGVRQMVWTGLAMIIALGVLILIRNHRVLARYRYVAMLVGIVLLLLPMLPGIGLTLNGARLWIQIGAFTFQPGEIAKIALAVFFAGYLVTARDSLSLVGRRVLGLQLPRARDLGPILIIWVVAMAVLIFQRDLGTSLLYFGLFVVMIYVSTGRLSWVLIGLGLFLGGAAIASRTLTYVEGRFAAWLDSFNPEVYDAQGGSYQLVQGLFGMAQGGLVGSGLGQGSPTITPLAESDYIIASMGEELGLVGLFAILGLYLLFVARGFRIGFNGTDDFGRLLAVGLSFVVVLQVFVVVGGVTRVIPLTGLTTPFLAAGGSALVANWIIAALLLRLSDEVRHQPRLVVDE